MSRVPDQFSNFLCSVDFYLAKPLEVAVVSPATTSGAELSNMLFEVFAHYLPNKVTITGATGADQPCLLLQDRKAVEDRCTAYICKNYTCDEPVTDRAKLSGKLKALAASSD